MRYPKEKAYRLLTPRLLNLITTINSKEGINAAPVDFCSPVSFSPCVVMISLTPAIKTYKNIKETEEFVINILPKKYLDQILRCAARYPEGINKLEIVGLKYYSSAIVKSPRIKEAKIWLECKFLEEKRISDHFTIFGEVLLAEVSDDIVKNGEVDYSKIDPVLHFTRDIFAVDYRIIRHRRYDYK